MRRIEPRAHIVDAALASGNLNAWKQVLGLENYMNDVTKVPQSGVPAHLAQYEKQRIGNVDSSDRVIPRIKLLQAISPELTDFPDKAKAGQFWHSIAQENMGPSLKGIPIVIRKSYVLWAPRNDDRGILARAMDGIHWEPANAEFRVKPKGSPKEVVYKTADTVARSGLDEFGTSIPGDPNSAPAASLTYNMLWFFPDFPEFSPSVIINTRSSIKPMQQLLSRIDSKPVPHFCQVYDISSVQQKGAEGPYFNFAYSGAGFTTAEQAAAAQQLYETFSKGGWVANDEAEEEQVTNAAAGTEKVYDENVASKF
jgi:hypothetical protein